MAVNIITSLLAEVCKLSESDAALKGAALFDPDSIRKWGTFFQRTALNGTREEQVVYFVASPKGYIAVKEHDLFIINSEPFRQWIEFTKDIDSDPYIAFAVEIETSIGTGETCTVDGEIYPLSISELRKQLDKDTILIKSEYEVSGSPDKRYTCNDPTALAIMQHDLQLARRAARLQEKKDDCLYCYRNASGKVQLMRFKMESMPMMVRIGFADNQMGVQLVSDSGTEKQTFPIKFCPMCGRKLNQT